jgi:hypothetical protein
MTLEEIKHNIYLDVEGKLSVAEAMKTMEAIETFKKAHHYLPEDVAYWYDQMQDWMEEQQAEIDEQMAMETEIKEEYEAYVWEQYLKD